MRKLVVVFLLATIVAAGEVAADDQFVVRVDTRIGFNGLFKPGRWTPIEITLQNLGPDIDGTLLIELTRRDRFGPNQHTNSYQRDLDLAAGAVKKFSVVLPLETAVYPLRMTITHGDATVVEQEVKLAGRSASHALVAVLSRRPSLDFLLPVFNSGIERSLDLVYPLVDYLPDRWQGYDGIDLLIVHDARIQALTPDQVGAIRSWVAAGGRMIISAGAHLGPADSEVLRQLSGLVPESVHVVTVGDLGFNAVGLPVLPNESEAPTVVSSFVDSPSTISYSKLGRGEIVVLPFDYTQFVRVAPATSLGMWASLLPRSAVLRKAESLDVVGRRPGLVPIAVSRRVFETDLLANQLDLPLYNFPSRLLVGGLAASFFVLAMGILLWTASRSTRGGAAIGVAGLVVVAGLTSLLGHLALTVGQQPPEALALSLEIAELGPDDGYALVTKDILLFSRQREDYVVSFGGSPVIVPLEYRGQLVRTDGPTSYLSLSVGRWGHENTVAMQIVEFDIRARIQRGIGYANVELHNESDVPIEGVVVLNDGFPNLIGRLMPHDVVEHIVMGSGVGLWNDIEWDQYVPPGDLSGQQAQLLRDLARRQRTEAEGGPGSLLVVGWRPSELIPSTVEPSFERHVKLNALVMRIGPAAGAE
ncbi:MAG: hypothetical protein V3S41_05180 [Spirochaetia bacterium]